MKPLLSIADSAQDLQSWISDQQTACLQVADALTSAFDLRNLATKIKSCSYTPDPGKKWLSCGSKSVLCPGCNWLKSKNRIARYLPIAYRLADQHPNGGLVLNTLTVASCPVSEVRTTIQTLTQGFGWLKERRPFNQALAYARTTEITRGNDGRAHVHLHSLHLSSESPAEIHDLDRMWMKAAHP